MGIQLPIQLPTTLEQKNYKIGIQLPLTLPFSFGQINNDDIFYNKNLPIFITPIENAKNVAILKISERPTGSPVYLPISQTVWSFSGLLVSENIVSQKKSQLLVNEKIYTEIIPNFSLISKNQLQISWTGTRVPRVEVYIKSLENEDYKLYGTYSWNRGSVIIPIESHSYYIKLQGYRDSGISNEYLMNAPLQIGIKPILQMVNSSDKIYNIDINYTSEYKIDVEY